MKLEEENQQVTSYIKHLAVSGLSGVLARIKSTCNLTRKCFEMPNVSYTYSLCGSVGQIAYLKFLEYEELQNSYKNR